MICSELVKVRRSDVCTSEQGKRKSKNPSYSQHSRHGLFPHICSYVESPSPVKEQRFRQ